ncbi:PepSY domain-containing protein [Rhizobium gallicum]|uniref:PepSY domain-containing protein n=1 Tax=Rhizobium gallicum TaxID=56730 RepID=UPI001EF83212|nr:PepSY domain-containing protein [Rhizobium gallicum]ULJ72272.1 PepSY domain-containing protein [Rhizobium gallicum]
MSNNRTLNCAMAALIATGAIGLAASAASGPAFAAEQHAGQDDGAEYGKLAASKITLSQAIDAAEKKFGGKAVNAALDNEQASAAFEVELMTDKGSQTVAVDGATGEAMSAPDTSEGGQEDVE